MVDVITVTAIAITFLLAGAVKGVIGLGLPTVSLALLTVLIGLTNAMALLLAPSLITNLWQALAGGYGRAIVGRLWPFLLTATVTVWLGALALNRVDSALLSGLLGGLLVIYSLVNLAGVRVMVGARHEPWLGPLAGTVNGVLTGMTGSFVVPGVLYLQAIGLPRGALIQAMGMLFTLSTLALAVALQGGGWLNVELGLLSIAAIVPAVAGMLLGQRLRNKLPEPLFRRLFFSALLLLGAYISASAAAAI